VGRGRRPGRRAHAIDLLPQRRERIARPCTPLERDPSRPSACGTSTSGANPGWGARSERLAAWRDDTRKSRLGERPSLATAIDVAIGGFQLCGDRRGWAPAVVAGRPHRTTKPFGAAGNKPPATPWPDPCSRTGQHTSASESPSRGRSGRAARFPFFALVAGASVPFGRRGQALARDSRRGG